MDALETDIARALGVDRVRRGTRIQSLWGGYGEAVRMSLDDGRSVVVKHVVPERGSGRGHERKLRSYAVEMAFYLDFAPRCPEQARVPTALHLDGGSRHSLFVLEDLAEAGFSRPARELQPMLRWLAHFHATFLGEKPKGLWNQGSYWHLNTRPDELRAMAPGGLKQAAEAIDERLRAARFQTLVHGDAKPANFLAGRRQVAAVDFQYVGAGPGVVDVAYLLSGEDRGTRERGLDLYFRTLREALPAEVDDAAVEEEWRALYPFAWADFHRFLMGWAPSWGVRPDEEAMTRDVLRQLRV